MEKNYIVHLKNGDQIQVNNIIQVKSVEGVYYLKERSKEPGSDNKTIFTTAVENVKYIIAK
ncbi:hypothetical protein [Lysinibacillus sphaericus]|uniref:hypothetical protein n=1 Tax=Lysinibacillus sphaericus TaxID=1421 RepID=UPI002DBBF3F9|nr:hypothetical protein [Lysinibacillus sphaericus]MEB7455119.1 hypothetical protein [Lysinibacillus sphaericus]